MRLFILGATGKTGRALVAQGLARGHSITAFGRSTPQVEKNDAFRAVVGNPLRADEIAAELEGHDAVLSALGPRGLAATSVLLDGARASMEAMRRVGLRRLLLISSSLVDSRSGWLSQVLSGTLLRNVTHDQRAMEEFATQSDLDWTVLRPGRLSNGVLTRRYAASRASDGIPASHAGMSREDLACMMLDTVERGTHFREIVWLRGARA